MNSRSIILAAPALTALLLLVGCSGDTTPAGTAGTSAGGASGGSGGSAGSVATGGGGAAGSAIGGGGAATGGGGSGAGGLTTGGGGSGGGSAGTGTGGSVSYPPTFATFKMGIYPHCTGGLCHDLNENPFVLKNDATMYMVLTTHMTKNCGPAIVKGSPEQSGLVKLLKDDCGGTLRMPYMKCWSGDPQDSDFCVRPPLLAALEQWIKDGAPEN